MIPFNIPYCTGKELHNIKLAIESKKICGNGYYTHLCQQFFENKFGFKKCLLTSSCTDALEMCAILANIKEGDEVIVPSYTFVSSALAFVRQGAKIVYADSESDNPNIDTSTIEKLITKKTKVIVPVHYAGVSCDMDAIMGIACKYNLLVVEDAAQGIDSYFTSPKTGLKTSLGGIAHMAAFSFHETKNIQCGEGGLLIINDERLVRRSEIIWEKGTNRAEFYRGEVNKYGWVDLGSSFLPSEYTAAFLYSQLCELEKIQRRRIDIWNQYYEGLRNVYQLKLPVVPQYATNNAHMFYVICPSFEIRSQLIEFLKENNVQAVFHYLSLHKSEFNKKHAKEILDLPMADKYTDCLLRLPLYYSLTDNDIVKIITLIHDFFS